MLQPWTPCLPIRGGKLKTSKNYSTSNPQLPFMCSSGSFLFNPNNNNISTANHHQQNFPHKMQHPNNTSSSSLNSSYIWREASPTNCNLYSASVSSLNTAYRHSLGHHNTGSPIPEDKAIWSNKMAFMSQLKNKSTTTTNNENVYMTPLLPIRKHKQSQHIKVWNKSATCSQSGSGTVVAGNRVRSDSPTAPVAMATGSRCKFDGLYDRRINRSFEAPPTPEHKVGPLRRSTPHLVSDDMQTDSASRHSATWCCGNFVLKQWRKINNYD